MNSSLKSIKAWRSVRHQRREQRSLEWWERVRAEGKKRFVRRTALTYGLTVAGVTDLIQSVFHDEGQPLLLRVIFYVVVGIVVGSCTWSSMEAKRKDARRKPRAKALPDSEILPKYSPARPPSGVQR